MKSLEEERSDVLASAQKIVDDSKAAGRELTAAQTKSLNEKIDEVKALDERIENSRQGEIAMKALFGDQGNGTGDESKGYADLGPTGLRRLGAKFAQAMTTVDTYGRKAILPAGDSVIEIPLLPADPVTQSHIPLTLASVLPTIKIPAGARANYIRQSVRTNNAAAVAAGDLKPTSVLGLAAVPVQLKVYANLSEAVDQMLVADSSVLSSFIANELLYNVTRALEADLVAGDPAVTPASIRGLLATSGIVVQAFATSLLASLRAAVTTAEQTGYNDSLIFVMSAADWAAAETARASTGGTLDFASGPGEAAPRRVWGVPVVTVSGLPAKTALLVNRSSVALYVDAGILTTWGTPGDTWTKNQIVARTEGRFDLAVYQPNAVIKIGTAA